MAARARRGAAFIVCLALAGAALAGRPRVDIGATYDVDAAPAALCEIAVGHLVEVGGQRWFTLEPDLLPQVTYTGRLRIEDEQLARFRTGAVEVIFRPAGAAADC